MTSPQIELQIKNLTNGVLRAARELRNQTQNLVRLAVAGEDARDAWKRLDEAIKLRDDFVEDAAQDSADKKGQDQ